MPCLPLPLPHHQSFGASSRGNRRRDCLCGGGGRGGKLRMWSAAEKLLAELKIQCSTDLWRLNKLTEAMVKEMEAGLASHGGSSMEMLISFVHELNLPNPNGTEEEGRYYALDLGGTNFRVLRVRLRGGIRRSTFHQSLLKDDDVVAVERHRMQEHLKTSTTAELFDFITTTLQNFIAKEEEEEDGPTLDSPVRRKLAFTFCFEVDLTSLASGTLVKWSKGFNIRDMVGKDVVDCLRQSMAAKGLNMEVSALVNDAVSTLALGHYHDQDTVVALIIGTGTNACYVENTEKIAKGQGLGKEYGGVVVSTGWGNFSWSLLPTTSYDAALDAESINPNALRFEKLISGMYLGEIVRRVILKMSQESGIFGPVSANLSQPFALSTPSVAAMREDESPGLTEVERVLREDLEIREILIKARELIVEVCDVVTRRAARLVAAGIAAVLRKTGRVGSNPRRTVVAIDGSVYTGYRTFRKHLREALVEILGQEAAEQVILKIVEDGSGIGAALLAASTSSLPKHQC